MKILMINSVCGIRSTGRICTDLAEELAEQGNIVKIAYGRECVPEKYKKYAVKIGSHCGVYINLLRARLLDNEGFNAKHATKKFLKWSDEFDPDVLHLHNLHGYYINLELLFGWIKSRPNMKVKWTLHDSWSFTGHCPYFTFVGCNNWLDGCHNCMQKDVYPASFLRDNSINNWKRKKALFTGIKDMTLITPSQWLADLVGKSYLKEYPVEVRHNTVDTDVFKPTESDFRKIHNLEDKKIVLGVASAWGQRKGLGDFAKLAEMLDDDYALVMVGIAKSQRKKLPPKVLCIKSTNSKQELASIYTAADVFVNLTYEDNYPTVNLESAACGTPVITYRTGGSVESVEKDNIVEQGDLKGIMERIKCIVES